MPYLATGLSTLQGGVYYERLCGEKGDHTAGVLGPGLPVACMVMHSAGAQEGVACAESEVADGAKVALQLVVKLPGACYATMLVRELTKTSTATAVHKKLTQQLPDAKVS